MAPPPDAARAPASTSLAVAVGLTAILGATAGASFGAFLAPRAESAASRHENGAATSEATPPKPGEVRSIRDISTDHVAALEPIITNITGPAATWVRFEGSVVFKGPPENDRGTLLRQITEDLMGFLRSTPLRQFETAAGMEFLREDLAELVRLRTKGRARDLIVRVLVVE
jgi:hypothetical protein